MIKVTIELIPDGDDDRAKILGVLSIVNDGSVTSLNGNYDLALVQYDRRGESYETSGRLTDYDRDKPAVVLVRRAFDQMVKDVRSMTHLPPNT